MSGCQSSPDNCSSCGFPIADAPPGHAVEDGSGRNVCNRCWHNPCLFFLPRELEIHGSIEEVIAVHEQLYRATDKQRKRLTRRPIEQMTLGGMT